MYRLKIILSHLAGLMLLVVAVSTGHAQDLSDPHLPDFAIVVESQSGRVVYKQPSDQDALLQIGKRTVRAGDTRKSLLRNNGFFVNANALMLFELLNPKISHHPLTLHSEISVPTISANSTLTKARRNGSKIKIVLYPKLKAEINELIEYGLCGAILAQYRSDLPEIRTYLATMKRSVRRLLSDKVSTSEATLKLILESLETKNGMLQAPCGADDHLEVYDLGEIAKGLKSIAQFAGPAQSSDVSVSVSTVGMNGEKYNNLEVFSRPEWLQNSERFPNLSSPSERSLSIGDYVISANGDPKNLYCQEVTDVKIRPQKAVFTVTIKCTPRGN